MAAAPVLDDRGVPTSPELALVDASLAEELRASLPDAPRRPGERTAAPTAPAELVERPAATRHPDLVVHPVVRELQPPLPTTPPELELDDTVQIEQPGSCLDLIVGYDEAEIAGAEDEHTHVSDTANQPDVPPASEHVDVVVETSAPTSVANEDPSNCVDLIVGYDEPEVVVPANSV